MKRTVLGSRTGPGHYYDIRDGFRMGDMACAHYCLLQWRHDNPDSRLYITWDSRHAKSHYGRKLPMSWVFGGIADEVWETSRIGEKFAAPNAIPIRPVHLWDDWFKLRSVRTVFPTIQPPKEYITKARTFLNQFKVPEKYVLYQPLMDAGYHHYRNAPPSWYKAVLDLIAPKVPVVVATAPGWTEKLRPHPKAIKSSINDDSPLLTMALSAMSSVHCGGETGLPLWASLFKVPVVAMFRHWKYYFDSRRNNALYDYMPMDCGKPVVYAQLESDPKEVADKILETFEGRGVSTPMDTEPMDIAAGGLWPRKEV